jgi:hypothetical protein
MMEGLKLPWKIPFFLTLLTVLGIVIFCTKPYTQFMPVFGRDILAVDAPGLHTDETNRGCITPLFGLINRRLRSSPFGLIATAITPFMTPFMTPFVTPFMIPIMTHL